MKHEITNCGLIALRNISTLKDVSVRTLIYMANDNGIKLYPYKVPLDKIDTVPFPAIFHAENHFIYGSNTSELTGYNLTGNVLLTSKSKMYDKIPKTQLKSVTGSSYAAIVVGVGTVAYGAYSKGRANKKAKAALANRKAYTTPDEIFQILNATTNKAQGDTQTRDFQTQQTDNAFANQLGVAELLGANPNDLSGMFQQKMQGILQVGQQFHQSNMEAFGKYTGALEMVASNSAAEWKSRQDFVKDDLQAAAADGAAANATINSGINTAMAGFSASQSNKLYKDYLKTLNTGGGTGANTGVDAAFSNGTIKDAIAPASVQSMGYATQPQRTVGTGVQTISQSTAGDYTQDAGFLQWLQTNGIGTKR